MSYCMTKSCVGLPVLGARVFKVIVALVAANVVGLSVANAQWFTKNDADTNAGFINNLNLVVNGAQAGNTYLYYGQPATVSLKVPGFQANTRVILKVYGSQGITSPQLFAKFMTQNSVSDFVSDLSNPANPNFVLPGGVGTLVAEVYQLYPTSAAGSTPWSVVTTANGIQPANSIDYNSHAVRRGVAVVDYGVNSFKQFVSRNVEVSVKVVATPTYRVGATTAQRTTLNNKAAAAATAQAQTVASRINSFSPYSGQNGPLPSVPGLHWAAPIVNNSATTKTVAVKNVPIASNRVGEFASSVTALASTNTASHPEGTIRVVTTVTAPWLPSRP